jgi:peptidoglycan/LPS O-acetylase OafA/YrhL
VRLTELPGFDPTPRPQLRALTGLRFFAAFHVLVYHCTDWRSLGHSMLRSAAGCGYIAVGLFYVLSGFILTYVHGGRDRGPLDRAAFYVNRFARIYPGYLFALLLVAPFYFVHTLRTEGATVLLKSAVAVLALVQAYVPSLALRWNPPAWSLSDEAFFYALFPVLLSGLVARGKPHAIWIGVASYVSSLAMSLAYIAIAPDGPAAPTIDSRGFWIEVLKYSPIVRAPEFVIGVVLGRLYLDEDFRRLCDGLAILGSFSATAMLGAVLVLSPSIPYPLLHNGLLAPLYGLLIVSLASRRGPIARLLGAPLLEALGEASYALYLIHVPLLILWAKSIDGVLAHLLPSSPAGHGASQMLFLASTIGVSVLTHKYVEIPLREMVRREVFMRLRRASGR